MFMFFNGRYIMFSLTSTGSNTRWVVWQLKCHNTCLYLLKIVLSTSRCSGFQALVIITAVRFSIGTYNFQGLFAKPYRETDDVLSLDCVSRKLSPSVLRIALVEISTIFCDDCLNSPKKRNLKAVFHEMEGYTMTVFRAILLISFLSHEQYLDRMMLRKALQKRKAFGTCMEYGNA